MSLQNLLSYYHTNPVVIRKNTHTASVKLMEDFFYRQYETVKNWYEHAVPSPYSIVPKAAFDIIENEEGFKLLTEVPGVSPENITLETHGHELYVKCQKISAIDPAEESYILHERFTGSFERTILFPEQVDISNATATLTQGMLVITVPKRVEAKHGKPLPLAGTPEKAHNIDIKSVA